MSILEKIKESLEKSHILIGLLVFLVVLFAFGIGYTLGNTGGKAPIIIEQNNGQNLE